MLAPRYGPCLGGVRALREQRTPLGAAVRDEAAGGERAARGSPTLGARAPLRPCAVVVRDRGVRLAPLRARPAEHAPAAEEVLYVNAKGALSYTVIAGEPLLYGNLPPRELSMPGVFRSAPSST